MGPFFLSLPKVAPDSLVATHHNQGTSLTSVSRTFSPPTWTLKQRRADGKNGATAQSSYVPSTSCLPAPCTLHHPAPSQTWSLQPLGKKPPTIFKAIILFKGIHTATENHINVSKHHPQGNTDPPHVTFLDYM